MKISRIKSNIDISIIIVSWNAKSILKNCLDSIINNTICIKYEIVVVDNASSDGSPEMVEKNFPHVKLVRNEENFGFAKANNIGINLSTGRYLFLVNSDIEVIGNCIENMKCFMDNNQKVGMSGPRILNADGSLQISCRRFPSVWNNFCQMFGLNKIFPSSTFFAEPQMKYWKHNSVKKIDVLSGCFWVTRREAVKNIGLLDEDFFFYGEDIDWCKRFHNSGWHVMFNPGAEAIHYGGASSSKAPIRFYLEMQKADLQYWYKHRGITGRSAYWMIILLRQLVRIPIYLLRYIFKPSSRQVASFKLKRAFACLSFLFGIKVKK